jgi:hypothetical protein
MMFSTVIAGCGEDVVRLTDAAMNAALDGAVTSPGCSESSSVPSQGKGGPEKL